MILRSSLKRRSFKVTSFFTFLLISEVTHRQRRRVYQLDSKVERAGQFEQFVQVSALCNQ